MTKSITQKIRAKVLWDAGFRSASSMLRFGKIPITTAERYIQELREDGNHNRNECFPRTKPQKAPPKIRKVILKARKRTKIYLLRQKVKYAGMNHKTTRAILLERKLKYSCYKKRVLIDEDTRQQRFNFARNMLERESDFGLICSFGVNQCRSGRVWTQNAMEEEVQAHSPKVYVWGAITSRGAISFKIFEENLNPNASRNMSQTLIYPQWSPSSPDLNLIENIWGWLKNLVSGDMPNVVHSLEVYIRKYWRSLDENFLAQYFNFIPERMQMIIENEGETENN